MFKSVNPFSGKVLATYKTLSKEELSIKLDNAANAYQKHIKTTYESKKASMLKLAELLKSQRDDLAVLITSEMGKLISESKAEIDKCAWLCEYYAEHSKEYLREEIIESDATISKVIYQPTGLVFGIMPWNFPFWQVLRAAVPTIMAGNGFVLKHAPNVFGCAVKIEELFAVAGFTKNIFTNLIIDTNFTEEVIKHPAIHGITLTGSKKAGSSVAALAGKHLKKSVLELGGSDPYIVLKDAEINTACNTSVCSRMMNSGQVCISAKRFIVVEEIYDSFIAHQKNIIENMQLGNPMDNETDIGPMARPDLLEQIHNQVKTSLEMGASLICGGKIMDNKFYAPTLLTNVNENMPVYREETFGPVSVVLKAKNAEHAIEIANNTDYGLGASLWTNDLDLAEKLANKIEAGAVFINGMTKSDPRLPFGGIKQSGYGRELSALGIREFLNAKTIWVK